MHVKISSAEWRPFCPRADELNILHAYYALCRNLKIKAFLLFVKNIDKYITFFYKIKKMTLSYISIYIENATALT